MFQFSRQFHFVPQVLSLDFGFKILHLPCWHFDFSIRTISLQSANYVWLQKSLPTLNCVWRKSPFQEWTCWKRSISFLGVANEDNDKYTIDLLRAGKILTRLAIFNILSRTDTNLHYFLWKVKSITKELIARCQKLKRRHFFITSKG